MPQTNAKNIAEVNGESHPPKDFIAVGIGASAGGVGALRKFFSSMPADSGMAFVVILHLSPQYDSSLAAILQKETEMPVRQVNEPVKVEPNVVYVIAPHKNLAMVDGMITLSEQPERPGTRVAIDLFFRTLADAYGKNGVCVVLSGTGTDGTVGLKRVKEANGFAIVQDPEDAEYDGMPRSAIATNLVDWVLPVSEMPDRLLRFKESSERLKLTGSDDDGRADVPYLKGIEALPEILTLIRIRTGHDFSNYKHATLLRRIARHLQIYDLDNMNDYVQLLRERPDDLRSLLKNLLINVTNFFRDKEAFDSLRVNVVPKIFADKKGSDTVRVWSVGCASGEEAYSLAILLSEYAARLEDPPKVQIFATDVDDDAIMEAREHRYPMAIEADVSPERLKQFFTRDGDHYLVRKSLREMILFAPHNVLRDPPFSRLDLVVCRNVLIYLNREAQDKVLALFHFATLPDGFLFLGNSESAGSQRELFAPVDKKQRIFSRRPGTAHLKAAAQLPMPGEWEMKIPEAGVSAKPDRHESVSDIHYKLVEQYAPPSVLVDEDFEIVHLSESAGRYFRFPGGEPTKNLFRTVHPDLLPDLRAALYASQQEKKTSEFENVKVDLDGKSCSVNLIVRPVEVADAGREFLLVIFDEVTARNAPAVIESDTPIDKDSALESVTLRLEEELRRTKDRLRSTVEQHETSVEELKASNEELQAINEELRSASEELETGKEELQSVNEELTTVNHELKDKIEELSRANADLQNLMTATEIGTIFLDRELRIKRYTPPIQNLFNVLPTDIGRPIEHLTHKLDYEELVSDAAAVVRSLAPLEDEIRDKDGRTHLLRILPYLANDEKIEGVVITFVDITDREIAEENLRAANERFRVIVNQASTGVVETDFEGNFIFANQQFCNIIGYSQAELAHMNIRDVTLSADLSATVDAFGKMAAEGTPFQVEQRLIRKDGKVTWVLNNSTVVRDRSGRPQTMIAVIVDINDQKASEEAKGTSQTS